MQRKFKIIYEKNDHSYLLIFYVLMSSGSKIKINLLDLLYIIADINK